MIPKNCADGNEWITGLEPKSQPKLTLPPLNQNRIMKIFQKNKKYFLWEIIDICDQNGLITVDCLKDEKMISVEKEGADCLYEFHQVGDEIFKLTWSYA